MSVPFEPTVEDLEKYVGFVYIIVDSVTNMKYIGKKLLFSSKILPVTKTRKRRKKTLVESDWKDYYGSNKQLQEEVALHGPDRFKRVILRLCESKGECSYYELHFQMKYDVLLKPDEFYNAFVGAKIHRNHILPKACVEGTTDNR